MSYSWGLANVGGESTAVDVNLIREIKTRQVEIKIFTEIDDAYEAAEHSQIVTDAVNNSPEEKMSKTLKYPIVQTLINSLCVRNTRLSYRHHMLGVRS